MWWLRQTKGDYLWLTDIVCAGARFEAIQHSRPLQSICPEWSKGQGLSDDLSTWSSRNLQSLWVAHISSGWYTRRSWEDVTLLDFALAKQKGKCYPAMKITDADYADDLAVLADVLKDATCLPHSIEWTGKEIGFYLNADKTEFIWFNQDASEGMRSLNGEKIKQVEDFKDLGSYIASTERDVNIRLRKAWDALNELDKIWKSNLPDNLKRNFFRAAVETVLLYGSVSWTLTTHLEKKIDGAFTRMLRTALNRSWKDQPTNEELHGHIPPISKSLQQQRMRFPGHFWCSKE